MKLSQYVSLLADSKSRRSCLCSIVPIASLLCLVFFIGTAFIAPDSKERLWGMTGNIQSSIQSSKATDSMQGSNPNKCENLCSLGMTGNVPSSTQSSLQSSEAGDTTQESKPNQCENQCRPPGSESLPKGMIEATSNLEMRPLWGFPEKANSSVNLLAVPVGIKQKVLVNEMVEKFLSSGFVVMLFHYDGIVDKWRDFRWSDRVIHVSAMNQTKWWFAKRFLHPEIVAEYSYVFLWDEDLGLEHFDPERYLSIVKEEGLEISQPGLDPAKSEMHHLITVRRRNSIVHRRMYKPGGDGKGCDDNSTAPPCTGWIEVMAPVFSRAAWRCVWYMIQFLFGWIPLWDKLYDDHKGWRGLNDLIHAWGLDMQLGYCAQGERIKNVGVVDSEYVVHHGLPTLGEDENKISTVSHKENYRVSVRRQSFIELDIFRKRWKKAADEDQCWVDPYQKPNQTLI